MSNSLRGFIIKRLIESQDLQKKEKEIKCNIVSYVSKRNED